MATNFFGIDFGTTNSAVAAVATTNGDRVGNASQIGEDKKQPLPSFVAIHKQSGKVKTGKDAKDSISNSNEYQIFSSIKTVIDEDKEWQIAGKVWTPVDIAAELFLALKNNVREKTNGNMELEEAVVAVPVGFSPKKKNRVRRAAKKAGIRIKMFISEPTAAYCSRLEALKKYKNVAVFDWGGGTLDVVVLRIENNVIYEVSSAGMPLAGNDIDRKLADKICLKAAKKLQKNFSFDDLSSDFQDNLLSRCEEQKCNFADEDSVLFSFATFDQYGRFRETIDYDYFNLLIENEVEQAVDCLLKALSEAGMNQETIDCILCEGGSSRLRPLQEKLLKHFDIEQLIFPRTAMWDIAVGAAEIAYRPGAYRLSRPIGIIQSNEKFFPLLRAGQRIPTEEKTVIFGIIDSSKEARFVFSDGEGESYQTFTEYFPVRLRGFDDEAIRVSCYVDADTVFRVKIRSNRMPDDYFRVWTYSNLKVAYEIESPEAEENKYAG